MATAASAATSAPDPSDPLHATKLYAAFADPHFDLASWINTSLSHLDATGAHEDQAVERGGDPSTSRPASPMTPRAATVDAAASSTAPPAASSESPMVERLDRHLAHVSRLLLKTQLQINDANRQMTQSFAALVAGTPRALQGVEQLHWTALQLASIAQTAQADVQVGAPMTGDAPLARLALYDRIKTRMEGARTAFKELRGWGTLEDDVHHAMAEKAWLRAAERLVGARRSLRSARVDDEDDAGAGSGEIVNDDAGAADASRESALADEETLESARRRHKRRQLLDTLQDQLVQTIRIHLLTNLESQSDADLRAVAQCFTTLGRPAVLTEILVQTQHRHVSTLWPSADRLDEQVSCQAPFYAAYAAWLAPLVQRLQPLMCYPPAADSFATDSLVDVLLARFAEEHHDLMEALLDGFLRDATRRSATTIAPVVDVVALVALFQETVLASAAYADLAHRLAAPPSATSPALPGTGAPLALAAASSASSASPVLSPAVSATAAPMPTIAPTAATGPIASAALVRRHAVLARLFAPWQTYQASFTTYLQRHAAAAMDAIVAEWSLTTTPSELLADRLAATLAAMTTALPSLYACNAQLTSLWLAITYGTAPAAFWASRDAVHDRIWRPLIAHVERLRDALLLVPFSSSGRGEGKPTWLRAATVPPQIAAPLTGALAESTLAALRDLKAFGQDLGPGWREATRRHVQAKQTLLDRMASDPPPPFTALCEVPFPTAAATPFESPEHPASSTYPAARLLATTASWQAATASATDVAVPLAVAVLDGPSGGESAFLLAALQTLYDAFLTPLGPILHRLCQRAPLSADRNAPAAATAAVSGGAPGTPVSGAAPPLPPSPAAYGPAALADLAEQLLLIPQRIEKVMQEQLTRDGLAHLPYITSDDLLVDDDNDETNDAKADAEPSSKADKSANEASAAADADGGSAEDDAQNDDESDESDEQLGALHLWITSIARTIMYALLSGAYCVLVVAPEHASAGPVLTHTTAVHVIEEVAHLCNILRLLDVEPLPVLDELAKLARKIAQQAPAASEAGDQHSELADQVVQLLTSA